MTDEQTIKEKILAAEDDSIFFRSDFPEHHPESVGRVLSQLTDENLLVRIASGIYVKPRMSRFGPVMPSVDKLVNAIAERDKVQVIPVGVVALNMLGLSTQVPMVYSYLTMGSARTIMIGSSKVILKRGVPRNFAYKTKLIALLVQALKALKEKNVEEEHLQQIAMLLTKEPDREALRNDVLMMPEWMRRIVKPMIQEEKK